MNKLKTMSESSFLKLFMAFMSACFIVGAFFMPDRAQMISGFWTILSSPAKISTNYFDLGGYAATFLNMGLVGVVLLALYVVFKATCNNVSTFAFILTVGFSSWGMNVINILPSMLGVVLYCLV